MMTLSQIRQKYSYSLIVMKRLVIVDFKLRYQGSVLGYLWSLLRPLFLFCILYVVFTKILPVGQDVPHYPVYLLTGIVFWNFFAEVTSGSVGAIVNKGDTIRKINFPKYVIILATTAGAMINLSLNLIVIGVFMALSHVSVSLSILWVIPLLAEIFIFAMSIGFILSAMFVRLRDVNYIWEVIMQAFFYATPVIYPLQRVSSKWPFIAKLLLLNPVAQALQDIRYSAITKVTQTPVSVGGWKLMLVPLALIPIVLVISAIYFKKRSPYFAEEV